MVHLRTLLEQTREELKKSGVDLDLSEGKKDLLDEVKEMASLWKTQQDQKEERELKSIRKGKEFYQSRPGTFYIFVKTLSGGTVTLSVRPEDTIKQVKEQLVEYIKERPETQRLIFGGHLLENERTVEFYDIEAHTTLHLVLRLRGGMYLVSSGRIDLQELRGIHESKMPDHAEIVCDLCRRVGLSGIRYHYPKADYTPWVHSCVRSFDFCEDCFQQRVKKHDQFAGHTVIELYPGDA